MARYLIGIDLGTTNSALAYADTQSRSKAGGVKLHTFPVTQLVAAGQFGEYFEPFTGKQLGSTQQSWTAAVTLDWLASEHDGRPASDHDGRPAGH